MSNKIRKQAPVRSKKWHPSAELCGATLVTAMVHYECDLDELDFTIHRVVIFDPNENNYRQITAGEITKGKRFLAREAKRAEWHEAEVKREQYRERMAEMKARVERDARKLESARAGMTKLVSAKWDW